MLISGRGYDDFFTSNLNRSEALTPVVPVLMEYKVVIPIVVDACAVMLFCCCALVAFSAARLNACPVATNRLPIAIEGASPNTLVFTCVMESVIWSFTAVDSAMVVDFILNIAF